jgi:hypothetical protein
MSAVTPADSTYAYIAQKVRRLTGSSSESSLKSSDIGVYINNFYNQNFPNSIKTDQMRAVYTFYTAPFVDRYTVDVNYWQGFRSPMYVDGIEGFFAKDRQQFFYMWPKWPTLSQPIAGNGVTQAFSFTVNAIPFYSRSFTLGGTSTSGAPILVSDDGKGNLIYEVPNPQVSNPLATTNPAIPGMYNVNTGNPGLYNPTTIGSVNYVTGAVAIDFSIVGVTPIAGQTMNLFVSQYTTGRPYSLLFWNNELTIRPVPRLVHKIEIEAYQTPVQFLLTSSNPIINQWVKYIAYGAAIDILLDRQDMAGVSNLMPEFKAQEGLVLERQATEEIGQRNSTIFSSNMQGQGNFYGSWGSWY